METDNRMKNRPGSEHNPEMTPTGNGQIPNRLPKEDQNPFRDGDELYPESQGCNMTNIVDESFRIDDNANYSTTALEENTCLNEPDVPGVGITDTDVEDKMPNKEMDNPS